MEGEDDMGALVENLGKGGGKPNVVGDIFKGGGAGCNYFWVGDVGDFPSPGPVPGGVQHRVSSRITGRIAWRFLDGSW